MLAEHQKVQLEFCFGCVFVCLPGYLAVYSTAIWYSANYLVRQQAIRPAIHIQKTHTVPPASIGYPLPCTL